VVEPKEIIESIYNSKEFNDMIEKVSMYGELKEDLKQEVILILLEYPEHKIVQMYKDKSIKFFVLRVTLNQFNSTTSPFYTKLKKFSTLTSEIINITEPDNTKENSLVFDFLKREIVQKKNTTRESYFDALLLEAYISCGNNVSELERRLGGMTRKTITRHLKRIREKIKTKWNKELS
jgi:DNA-binding transcriptional ArsR family regulator